VSGGTVKINDGNKITGGIDGIDFIRVVRAALRSRS
jgi:hypothetical protein